MGSTNKLMEASMALLQGAPDGQLNIVVLNKGLFYLDLIALRDLGRTITGERYVALPQGPVVDNYGTKIVRALEVAGLAEQLEMGRAKPMRVKMRLGEYKHLSELEVLFATDLARTVSPFTSTMLSDFSHRNAGWVIARRQTVEGGPAAEINMRIAMQQLAGNEDDDEWLTTCLDDQVVRELEQAEHAVRIWE
jgi:hypothetical protein